MVAIALVAPLTEGRGVMYTNPAALRAFAQDGVNTGTTTLTDLGSQLLMDDAGVGVYESAVDEDFPARLNVFHFGLGLGKVALSFEDAAKRLVHLRERSSRQIAIRQRETHARRHDPGLHGPAVGAGLLRRPAQRDLGRQPGGIPRGVRDVPPCGHPGPCPLQRRPDNPAVHRDARGHPLQVPEAGPPPHGHPLAAEHQRTVPSPGRAGRVRQHLRQPHLGLGRPAHGSHRRPGPRITDERGGHGAAPRGPDLVALRFPRDTAGPAAHHEARGHPVDRLRAGHGRTRTNQCRRMRWKQSPSAAHTC